MPCLIRSINVNLPLPVKFDHFDHFRLGSGGILGCFWSCRRAGGLASPEFDQNDQKYQKYQNYQDIQGGVNFHPLSKISAFTPKFTAELFAKLRRRVTAGFGAIGGSHAL